MQSIFYLVLINFFSWNNLQQAYKYPYVYSQNNQNYPKYNEMNNFNNLKYYNYN